MSALTGSILGRLTPSPARPRVLAGLRSRAIDRLATFHARRNGGCRILRLGIALLFRVVLKATLRLRVRGRENLPKTGPFVIVANHTSHLDAPCLLASLPVSRAVMTSAAAASDYFFASLPGAAAAALLTNALPFNRRCSTARCLRACRELLGIESHDSSRVLIVFPEGTRSGTGSIGPFKRGIGELVAGTDLPVVPCHIDGAFDAWPKHRWVPRCRKVRVTIGKPRTYARSSRGKTSAIAIASDLRNAVISLENIMRNRDTGALPVPGADEYRELGRLEIHSRSHGRGFPRSGRRPRVTGDVYS